MAEITGPKTPLKFKVSRHAPEMISPAQATPYEHKELSDLDSVEDVQFQVSMIQVYKNARDKINQHLNDVVDPAKVIKEAIAKALVPYYPLAGRLRPTTTGGRVMVECNGEGILFIEADADITLEQFGHPIYRTFCIRELLYDVPGSIGILHCPLIVIQVTRLKCGGFTIGHRVNHSMLDGIGVVQFLKAVAELARGANFPTMKPVWERKLLTSINPPPQIIDMKNAPLQLDHDMVSKCFFFGPTQIKALRRSITPSLGRFTKFDLIAAHLWRSRTIALYNDPNEVVQIKFAANIRSKHKPPIPDGYYGNGIVLLTAKTTAKKLANTPFHYALEVVMSLKHNEACINSVDDRVVTNSDNESVNNPFCLSDLTQIGLDCIDFGWGNPLGISVYAGMHPLESYISFLVPFKHFGEVGVLAPICLPRMAMDKFVTIVGNFSTLSSL